MSFKYKIGEWNQPGNPSFPNMVNYKSLLGLVGGNWQFWGCSAGVGFGGPPACCYVKGWGWMDRDPLILR